MECRLIKLFTLLFICAISTLPTTAQTTIKVAAAANLRYALNEIELKYEAQHKDIDLQINYGASGAFCQQIINGAPYDLFLSADDILPKKLKDEGVTPFECHIYALGKLAIYSLREDIDELGLKVLDDPQIKRIAVANPRTAPYGVVSVEMLKSLGVWDRIKNRVIYGDSIAQAAQFTMSGNCDIGFTALSLLLNPEIELNGSYFIIPEQLCEYTKQGGIVLNEGEATKFFDYILSEACGDIWDKYGYSSSK